MHIPRLWYIYIYNTYTDCDLLFQYFHTKKDRQVDITETNSSKDRQLTFQDPSVSLHKILSHFLDGRDVKWWTFFCTFLEGWTLKGKVPVGVTMGCHKKRVVFGFWLIICNEKWMFQYIWIVCLIIWKAEPIFLMLTKHFWQVIYTHLSSLTLPNGAIYFPDVCWKWLAKMCAFCPLQKVSVPHR